MSHYRGPRFKKIRRLGALPGLTNKSPKTENDLRNQPRFPKKYQYRMHSYMNGGPAAPKPRTPVLQLKNYFIKRIWLQKLSIVVLTNPTVSTFIIFFIIKNGTCIILLAYFLIENCIEKITILVYNHPEIVPYLIQKIVQIVISLIKDFLMIILVGFLVRRFTGPKVKKLMGQFFHLYSLLKIGLLATVLFLVLSDLSNFPEVLRIFIYTTKDSLVGKYLKKILPFVICIIKITLIKTWYTTNMIPPSTNIVYFKSFYDIFLAYLVPVLALFEFFKLSEVPLYMPKDSCVAKYILLQREPESLFRMAMYLVWLIRDGMLLTWGRKYLWNNTPIDPEDLGFFFILTSLILNFPLVWILY
uniref:Uncharacterized protein n=1 Tax=Pyrola rotundifolia TaxID=13651 RepID=A0A1B1CZM2_9ERIC|nr:putative protein, rps4-like [Pyrola rotundifolia]